jgi:hypothetical protein
MTLPSLETARHEVKFISREYNLQRLMQWIRLHPAAFTSRFPPRTIHNIYFDTEDHTAYRDNLAGISARSKVRYRWYGQERAPMAGTLEIKRRRNCFGWKVGFAVKDAPYEAGDSWTAIRERISGQVEEAGRAWLEAHSMPALLNEYHRQYFVSADSAIRVTVDTGLCTWDQRFKPYPNLTHGGALQPVVVAEVKFDRLSRDSASIALTGMPMRVSRNSKYVTGIQSLLS